jgi:hypothetical protein
MEQHLLCNAYIRDNKSPQEDKLVNIALNFRNKGTFSCCDSFSFSHFFFGLCTQNAAHPEADVFLGTELVVVEGKLFCESRVNKM